LKWNISVIEKNLVPDFLIRTGIRKLLRQRLREEGSPISETPEKKLQQLIDELKESPIAIDTAAANAQHYEIPTSFNIYCLGKHLKYSCGYWNEGVQSLDEAEEAMLEITCHRAEISDGQDVLELGCGWGSLSLFMSQKFPGSRFTVVSNSHSQKSYIDNEASKRGIKNLTVITSDMNHFEIDHLFDRVVSVEMFEHMRNYKILMHKIARWLKPQGKLFVHIFTHKKYAYKFEVKDETDWMSQYFFTGGIMPSEDLLLHFMDDLIIEKKWQVNGLHYAKTAEAWLKNMDSHRQEIMPIMRATYGKKEELKWWVYWRIFFMSCAELWKFNNGTEWMVSHYLFVKK